MAHPLVPFTLHGVEVLVEARQLPGQAGPVASAGPPERGAAAQPAAGAQPGGAAGASGSGAPPDGALSPRVAAPVGELEDTFTKAEGAIAAIASSTVQAIRNAEEHAARPDHVQVCFGLSFSADGGVIVAGASGQASLQVTLIYDTKAPADGAGPDGAAPGSPVPGGAAPGGPA